VRFSDWRGTPDGPYHRGVLIRTTIGLGAAAAGLTALTYGIAQAIENGSCGVDEYGNVLEHAYALLGNARCTRQGSDTAASEKLRSAFAALGANPIGAPGQRRP